MPKISKLKTTVIIFLISFGLIVGIKIFNFRTHGQSSDSAKVKGSKSAPIKIIEYGDF